MNKKIEELVSARNDFPELIRTLGFTGTGIEIGVARGDFSEVLLTSPLSKFYMLDCWWPKRLNKERFDPSKHSVFDFEFADNEIYIRHTLRRFWDINRAVIIRGFSEQVGVDFSDNTFDFIYIDANHLYDGIKADLAVWWPKVKPGGIFAGHDYFIDEFIPEEHHSWTKEVKRAVDEFTEDKKQKLKTTIEMWPSWWLIKE